MIDDWLECPQDPGNFYLRSVCTAVFRSGEMRCWCRTCPHFDNPPPTQEVRHADDSGIDGFPGSS